MFIGGGSHDLSLTEKEQGKVFKVVVQGKLTKEDYKAFVLRIGSPEDGLAGSHRSSKGTG